VAVTEADGHGTRPKPFKVGSRAAMVATTLTSRTLAKLYVYDTLLKRLSPDLQDVAAARRPFIQEEHPWCASDTSPGIGTWPPPIRPASEMGWWGARNGRVVTKAVRSPVSPATLWIRVVSMASASVIAGRMVVSRRASMGVPAPGGPMRRTLWSQRRQ
jgi:hypothetical protein